MAAYSADPDTDRTNPEAFVKDSVITTKVKTKLASEHLGSLGNVRVDRHR
jgi:hyperosmotically inducible protein